MQKVEIREWQGASTSDLVGFIKRKSQVTLVNGRIQGGAYVAEVPANRVTTVTNLSGIRFAGKALQIRALDTTNNGQNSQTSDLLNMLQGFLQSRYDVGQKLLNLTDIRSEPVLQAQGVFNTEGSTNKIFQALIKVAENPLGDVQSVSLAQNQLRSIDCVENLSKAFPKLRNLSLANNFINTAATLGPWKQRFPMLKELVLSGNAISDNADEMKKLIDFFPRLVSLNGVIVRSEADFPKLPMPIQQNFFENGDIQQLAQNFLGSFFKCWDSDRSQLLSLYDQFSMFSYAWDAFCPHMRSHNSSNGPVKWLSSSRNLLRMNPSNQKKFITEKIAIGSSAIGELFKKMPRTNHRLTEAENFATEAWQVQNVRQTPDTGIVVAVHGSFTETGPKGQRFGFDRFLVLLPGSNGNMLIASDMLTVRWTGDRKILQSNREDASSAAAVPPAAAGVTPGAPSPAGGTPAPATMDVVQQIMQQTRLTAEYATQCAQQANFDLQAALQLFEQYRQTLPAGAYI